jgi:hypothetical protein
VREAQKAVFPVRNFFPTPQPSPRHSWRGFFCHFVYNYLLPNK